MHSGPSVAIVGAGFSGSLLALNLLEFGPPDLRILLIERHAGFGPGLAYGTHHPEHLLNVRVGNMSAFPDRPHHLEEWLSTHGHGRDVQASAFVTRSTYGEYIASLLRRALARPEGAERLVFVHDEATSLKRTAGGGALITLALGNTHLVDAVVLAVGNLPPSPLPGIGLELLPADLYAADPWAPSALARLDEDAPVLLLGTGLTMIDTVISLEANGHRGRVTAISRRGLTPRSHGRFWPIPTDPPDVPNPSLSELVRWVRHRAARVGWWEAVDALRPATQSLWRRADLKTRRRFLRHLRPWWDVHRHRMAPRVADRIEALRKADRLSTHAGRVLQATLQPEGAAVVWRRRGASVDESLRVGRIINCTGPSGDPSRAKDPLVRQLMDRGEARIDDLGIGLEVDANCRVLGADGRAQSRLYAVGPITKGSFWEVVAVPDIRRQVAGVARLVGAQLDHKAVSARSA